MKKEYDNDFITYFENGIVYYTNGKYHIGIDPVESESEKLCRDRNNKIDLILS